MKWLYYALSIGLGVLMGSLHVIPITWAIFIGAAALVLLFIHNRGVRF